jgi:hypothetical protein
MNIFSAKSIVIYSLAIGGSMAFFQLITSYGEAKIKAPIAITGIYRLDTTTTLPDCLQGKRLLLNVQQSGQYLNASPIEDRSTALTPISGSNTARDTRLALSGRLRDRQFELSGKLPTEICPQHADFRMIGSFIDRKLQGKLWLPSARVGLSNQVTFTGTAQISPSIKKSH